MQCLCEALPSGLIQASIWSSETVTPGASAGFSIVIISSTGPSTSYSVPGGKSSEKSGLPGAEGYNS